MIEEHSQHNLCDTAVPVKTQLLIYQIVSRLWFSVSASSKQQMMLFPLKLLVSFYISSDLLSIGLYCLFIFNFLKLVCSPNRYRAKSYDIWFNISKHSSQSWGEKWSARSGRQEEVNWLQGVPDDKGAMLLWLLVSWEKNAAVWKQVIT